MLGLSPEDEAFYQTAKALQGGMKFAEAAAKYGKPWWSERFFGARVGRILTSPGRAALSAATRKVFEGGVRAAGAEAVAATNGALAAAGLSTLALVLAVLIGVAALGGGIYMAANWGKPSAAPVAAGSAMAHPGVRNVSDPSIQTAKATDPYGVFIGGGYNEVIVGQMSVIMSQPSSSLVGWGTDRSKTVKDTGATFTMVLGPFKTADEARKAYEGAMVAGSQRTKPFASGTAARFSFDGKEHDIDNATRFLR